MQKNLIKIFSKVSEFLFNGNSNNSKYYFLPIDAFLCYHFNEAELKITQTFYEKNSLNGVKEFYEFLNILKQKIGEVKTNHEVQSISINTANDKSEIIHRLTSITHKNKLHISCSILLHGSYADRTTTAASDIDDVVFIKNKVLESLESFENCKKGLMQLNHFYQKTDFTQHHGHWIFDFYQVKNYSNEIMPIAVLKNAISIGNKSEINIQLGTEKKDAVKNILQQILLEIETEKNKLLQGKINFYDLKNFISGVSLIIPLIFQYKGEEIDKKEAIKNANKIYSDEALNFIINISSLREKWNELPEYKKYKMKYKLLSYFIKNRLGLEYLAKREKGHLTIENFSADKNIFIATLNAFHNQTLLQLNNEK